MAIDKFDGCYPVVKYGKYNDWNLYRIPWTLSGRAAVEKVAATRYEFCDLRSPVVHFDIKPDRPFEECERLVKYDIDAIEAEGFDAYMERMFPESVKA